MLPRGDKCGNADLPQFSADLALFWCYVNQHNTLSPLCILPLLFSPPCSSFSLSSIFSHHIHPFAVVILSPLIFQIWRPEVQVKHNNLTESAFLCKLQMKDVGFLNFFLIEWIVFIKKKTLYLLCSFLAECNLYTSMKQMEEKKSLKHQFHAQEDPSPPFSIFLTCSDIVYYCTYQKKKI